MATDGEIRYKVGQTATKKVRVKGNLEADDWADYSEQYKQLALGFGLKVTTQAAKKKAVKKKAAKKKAAKKKSATKKAAKK